MKAEKENKETQNAPKKKKKKAGKIVGIVLAVLAVIILAYLVFVGKAWGVGPFTFLRVRPVSVSEQPYKYEKTDMYCQNGDKKIFGSLYIPKDGKDTRGIVILSHGFGGNSAGDAYLAKSFASSGIAVYAFDFCGGSIMGKSDGKMTEMSIMTEKDDLNHVIDTVKALDWVDPDHIVLFGESQGGCVSALTAAERDDVSALVLFYPALMIPSNTTKEFASIEDIPEEPEVLGQKVGKNYHSDIWGIDAFEIASAFTGPVLIVHGTADGLVPSEVSAKMDGLYADSRLYLLEGGGHGFIGDQVREAMEQVYAFLAPMMK